MYGGILFFVFSSEIITIAVATIETGLEKPREQYPK